MGVETVRRLNLDPPESPPLRVAFLSLWFIDMVAATLFFVVPYANELNPVTVLFFEYLGFAGVPLAASLYAVIIMGIGHVLSHPRDIQFIGAMVALYTLFVVNNVLLLLSGEPLVAILGV
ncbi:hypothetical protein C483_07903 [Natrialba hulunbeirensis JCM 10989]|uniref:DUF5658 domain-containing protein n=1 Tax=Natrialba hulunbeirensis JCM 10989 TaxID=1227493 RepID=M0A3B7_9EURY|nr:hypothetical protein [Natrialba hulunbeirensis]ELY92362.1 hypothetical protein C483_07903 [Natrialba hulunbeirensis JCM 10989]